MSSFRRIVSSPAFLAAWALAGIPPAAMLSHDMALAATTGAALPAMKVVLTVCAQAGALLALRLMGAATDGSACSPGAGAWPRPGP